MKSLARWMQHLDERILEALNDEGPLSPGVSASRPELYASEARLEERLLVLSHADFTAPFAGIDDPAFADWWLITTKGQEYLRGELDARYHRPPPRVRRDRGGGHPATVYL